MEELSLINVACVLNIIASPLIYLLCPIYFTRYFKLGWINMITIPVAVALPVTMVTMFSGPLFFLEGGLFNPYFQYALSVDNLHNILASLTMIWLVRRLMKVPAYSRFVDRVAHSGIVIKPERMRAAGWLFLGLFVVAFVLLAQPTYGLVNWILNPRTGYQSYRTGAGQWYALAITFLSVSIVLATTYARSTYTLIVMSPLYMFCTYLLGSKGFIISFAAYLVIILGIRQFRYFKPLAAVVLLGGLGLVAYNLATSLGGFGLQQIAEYSDYFVNAAKYYESHLNGEIPLYWGEVTFTNFWWMVPRAIYPNKPYVYGIIKIIDIFYPGFAEASNTPAFSTVEYYCDFGWLGVVVYGLFNFANITNGFLYAMILPRIRAFNYRNGIPHTTSLLYAFLWLAGPSFLFFFVFPLNIILFYIIIKIIDTVNRLHIVWKERTPTAISSTA